MLKRLRETPSSSSSSSSAASGEERNHNCCVSRLTLEAWPPPPPFLPPVPPAKDRNGGSVAGSGKSQEWDTRLLTHGLKLPSKSKNGVLLQNSINNKDICIMPSERIPSHRSSYEMPAKKAKKEADFCHADLATRKAQNSKLCFPQPGRKDIDEEEEDEEDGKEAEAVDGRILSSLVLVDVDLDGQTVRSKGKDRHSKVRTAKGLRDRRVRLSAPTAIQFFDVQDRLGFDQPSKAVDWLLRNAKAAIEELQQLKEARRESTQEINKSKEEEKEETKNVSASSSPLSARISTPGPALKAEKESALESPASSSSLKRSSGPKNSSPVHDKNRAGLRAKARERARERANLMKGKDSFLLIPAANEGIKEGDSRDDNDHCSNLNKPNQAEQERVGSPQEQQQQQSHCAYTFPQSHQQSGNERSASNSTPVAPSELSHHLLLLKQQQALQASLLSYLLSNVPRDTANTVQRQFPTMHPAAASTTEAENASRLHAPSSSSSSSQQQPPWQEQVMYEDRPGFRQSNLNLYCQGGAGAPQQPLSTTNSTHASAYSKSREDRAAAALVYSHLLLGHYQLDSQISSQQAYQAPAALRPPSPSTTMNESMNRHGFYNHHNPHHYHHYQQQLPPPQPPLPTQAAWANQNYQQSSTGGTLQSIFSPTSNSLLLLSATSEHTTTPPSSSTASANLLNINIASRSIPAWSIPDHHDGPSPPTSSWSHH